MKKYISIVLILILSVLITGCIKEKPKKMTDALKFKEEYESINNKENKQTKKKNRKLNIPEDNPFVYATAEDIVRKIDKKENFIVYFGFNSCPWCRSVLEELIHAAKDKGIGTIYYVDVLNIRDVKELGEDGSIKTTKEGEEAYMKLIEFFDSVLENYTLEDENGEEVDTLEKRIYAPNVVAVANGEAIQLETGISDKLTDPYSKLTKEIKNYAYKQFTCLMKCFEEESTTCQKNSC